VTVSYTERAGALYSWVSQYTLAAPDSRVDATLSLLRLDKIDLPFLMPVPAARGRTTVQGGSHPSRSVRTAIAKFARSRQRGARRRRTVPSGRLRDQRAVAQPGAR